MKRTARTAIAMGVFSTVFLAADLQAAKSDPLAGIVPNSDPVVRRAPDIVPALKGKHPRLLFSAEDVPALRAFARSERGEVYYKTLLSYLGASSSPPSSTAFLRNATDGQRQGLWRLPTVAMHYVLTGEKKSFDATVAFMKYLLAQPHWELGEIDNGMSAANIMIGAALAYDWLYNDLDPDFRERYRRKLWSHARRMYYAGHLKGDKSGHHYWEGDPQNNHRWHRDAGLALCALAAYTGEDHQKWLMSKLYDEMKFIVDWLPEDGTSHESFTYMIFGAAHLTLGVQAADRCFGTDYLQRPFFADLPRFIVQSLAPGLTQRFRFGDQGAGGAGRWNYDAFVLQGVDAHEHADLLAVVDAQVAARGVAANSAWMSLLWYPKTLASGRIDQVPNTDFFPDLGLLLVREGWDAVDAGAMFKCGPLGGYLLNAYRQRNNDCYINVAHDDPDANSFMLFAGGAFLAESDGYSEHKRSANHNTILINGVGQTVPGRREDQVFSQPASGGHDMTGMAVVTALARDGGNVAIEGEAGGAYPAIKRGKGERPALDRFRRIFVWVEGKYVLVLDDIRAPKPVNVAWLMQGPELEVVNPAARKYILRRGDASCPFAVAATGKLVGRIGQAPADHRGKPLGWRQLRLNSKTRSLAVAAAFDLWNHGGVSVKLISGRGGDAKVVVTGSGIQDTWTWKPGKDRFAPSTLSGRTAGGATILTMRQSEPKTRALVTKLRDRRR